MAGLTGGIKMHSKTEFSAYLVQFDKELLDFFERWRDAVKQCTSKERLISPILRR